MRVLAAPRRVLAHCRTRAEIHVDVRGQRQHFLRRRRGDARRASPVRVLAPPEAVDDAIGELIVAARSLVEFREHAGNADERQRALALSGVQVAVAARHAGRAPAAALPSAYRRRAGTHDGSRAPAPTRRAIGRLRDPSGFPTPSPSSTWQGRVAHAIPAACRVCTRPPRLRRSGSRQRRAGGPRNYCTLSSEMSNTSVAFGGITGGEPADPYASSGGMINRREPPIFMPATPWSQPLITWPAPRVN